MANPKITKDFVVAAVEQAGKIIKSGKPTKKAEDLLTTPKKEVKIGPDKKVAVTADGETETVLKVSKAGLKKKIPDVAEEVSDDALSVSYTHLTLPTNREV